MNRFLKYGLLLAGVLAAVTGHQLARPKSTGIFYRVTGGNSTVYILGSIHVGSRDMYPMSGQILSALSDADTVFFECDTTSEEAQMASSRLMKSEMVLSERVSPECFHLVEAAAGKLGYSMEELQKLETWAITSMMTVSAAADEMKAANAKTATAFGVENIIRKQLKEQKIGYLESAEYQIGLMKSFSPELQEYLLSSACQAIIDPDQKNTAAKEAEFWPEWWANGDADAFAESYVLEMKGETEPELADEYHQTLLVSRNRHMAQKIGDLLSDDQNKDYFVVVGLMHLVLPDDSILAELETRGYVVERIRQ